MGNINLVTNPSFETNSTGWTFTNATQSRDTFVTPGTGGFSCKLVATSTSAMKASYTVSGLTVGQRYVASAYLAVSPVSAVNFSPSISVGGVFGAGPLMSAAGFFQRRLCGFIATATTATIAIFSEQGNVVGDVLWFDRVQVTAGSTLSPYFDGSYPLCSWTGTAHASTSSCSFLSSTVDVSTDEVVVVNGLCLNTLAMNIQTKTGRYAIPSVRGDNLVVPTGRGQTFQPNRPIDSNLWTLSMFLLGSNPDGSIPGWGGQRALFENNLYQLLSQVMSISSPVTIYAWQPDGSVRSTQATLLGGNNVDISVMMGGRRGEITLPFEVLSGVWSDVFSSTTTGVASAGWSAGTLSLPALSGSLVPIEDAVLTVTGPITNPRVTNAATGVWVQYTGTVSAGQQWVVDSSAFTSLKASVSVLSATTHSGYPKFMLIDPGNYFTVPSLQLTGTGTTSATNFAVTAVRQHFTA